MRKKNYIFALDSGGLKRNGKSDDEQFVLHTMIFFYFFVISLSLVVNYGCGNHKFASELHDNTEVELLWVRVEPLTIDLMGKHFSSEKIKVYTIEDQERMNELEQKLEEALKRMDECNQRPSKRRSWFGCGRKRKRVELPPLRYTPRPRPVVVHVHSHPPTISNNVTNTNTNTFPPITNANSVTCPPACTTVTSTSVSNSSPKQQISKQETNSFPKPEISKQEKESYTPVPPPPVPEKESPAESSPTDAIHSFAPSSVEPCPSLSSESTTADTTPTEGTELTISKDEFSQKNKDENREQEPDPIDSFERKIENIPVQTLVSTSEESMGDSDTGEEEPHIPEKSSSEREPSIITVLADINFGKKKESSKELHPIYGSPKYSRRPNKESSKKSYPGFGLQVSVNNLKKKKTERPMHPIYGARSTGNKYGVRSIDDEDDLIRKVRIRRRVLEPKPKPEREPDDLIRKVNVGKRKRSSSSESGSVLSDVQSVVESVRVPQKRVRRRLALIAKYWPEVSEEDLYTTKYRYTRHAHPQLEYKNKYLTRQPRGKKPGINMNKLTKNKKKLKDSPKKKDRERKKP